MYVTTLHLQNYRNLAPQLVKFSQELNIFSGANAQGKTNLLEAVYLCATGRSKRVRHNRDLIRFDAQDAYLQLSVTKNISYSYPTQIDIHLQSKGSKGIAVNGLPIKKLSDLFGTFLCVMFTPEDLRLVKEGPAERRRFIDIELCQISPIYLHHLQTYYNVLQQRNTLLKNLRGNRAAAKNLLDTISLWDTQLVEHGTKIFNLRQNFITEIAQAAKHIHQNITNHKESLLIEYRPNITPSDFSKKLASSLDRDISLGSTSTGLHKDDLYLSINGTDARVFASQGQQRTASLSAKLAQLQIMTTKTNDPPVLLLDDVLSELDESRQTHLLQNIKNLQTLITCTGTEDIFQKIIKTHDNYNHQTITNGTITPPKSN